jgi:glycosyltransferase involved in cell wall biosynthesis
MLEPWALSQKKWKKRIAWFLYQRRLLMQCRLVHATSTAEESNLRKLGLTMPVAVIPNGMDLPGLTPPEAGGFDKQATRRNALFLSRLHPKKGLELLIEAWASTRPPNWHLFVAGPGDPGYIQSLKDLAARHHLQTEIEFLGPVSDLDKPSLFERTQLFLLPSYSENFGMVVAEALSFGVPVITTTGCPWSELRSFRCGWWVEPTSSAIAGALSEATTLSSEILAEMGRRGRSLISERYAWSGIARRMRAAYGEILLSNPTN